MIYNDPMATIKLRDFPWKPNQILALQNGILVVGGRDDLSELLEVPVIQTTSLFEVIVPFDYPPLSRCANCGRWSWLEPEIFCPMFHTPPERLFQPMILISGRN